jgi:excisionase family DNA binding protein
MIAMMEELLTAEDVARILRIHVYTAREMLKSGEIPGGFKIGNGRQWKIKAEDLRNYIEDQKK